MRYFVLLQYDGTAYHGWQIQTNAVSIQETIEGVFSTWFRTPTPVVGCGRTDTGVHAHAYVLHFDHAGELDVASAIFNLNNMLPKDISILDMRAVHADAHARFDATSRRYRYSVHQHKSPFAHFSSKLHYDLDLDLMNVAGERLLSISDFSAFCKSGSDVKGTICKVTESVWTREGTSLTYHITANRFLRNMVRAAVGTLVDVGRGYTTLEAFDHIMATGERGQAGMSAEARGLSLIEVRYPYLDFGQA